MAGPILFLFNILFLSTMNRTGSVFLVFVGSLRISTCCDRLELFFCVRGLVKKEHMLRQLISCPRG